MPELRNVVEHALVRSRGGLVRPEHVRLPEPGIAPSVPASPRHAPALVSLERGTGHVGPDRSEDRIQAYVLKHGSISNPEVRDLLGVGQQRASYLLKQLRDQGLQILRGTGRWGRYCLSQRAGHALCRST